MQKYFPTSSWMRNCGFTRAPQSLTQPKTLSASIDDSCANTTNFNRSAPLRRFVFGRWMQLILLTGMTFLWSLMGNSYPPGSPPTPSRPFYDREILVATPNFLEFGQVQLLTTMSEHVTLYYEGELPLTGLWIRSSQPEFIIQSFCPSQLWPGGSCQFEVKFRPTSAHHFRGNIIVESHRTSWTMPVNGQGFEVVHPRTKKL